MYEEKSLTGRLNTLYQESRMKTEKFADVCDVSYSAMQNYLNGTRDFPSKKIPIVCAAFSVSADWLLGLSDTRSNQPDIQTAIKTLGLSEKAVSCIIDVHGKDFEGGLSKLIEHDEFLSLAYDYADFCRCLESEPEKEEGVFLAWERNKGDGRVSLDPRVAVDLFGSQVVMDMSVLIHNDIYKHRHSISSKNLAALDQLDDNDK